ncbi:MAG: glycosyltransferase family 4 protein [bacterium]|nr:glycosyltransferase family 4 protein [bacterium]
MKLIYIANVRIPTEKAHGIQIMKTCESLAECGVDLELWLPRRRNPVLGGKDPFAFYGVRKNFKIKKFWSLDLIGRLDFLPGAGFFAQSKTFTWSLGYHLARLDKSAVIYSRDIDPLLAAKNLGLTYYYEAHTLSARPGKNFIDVLKSARGAVAISDHLAEELKKYLPEGSVIVARDGVDLDAFTREIDKTQARLDLGFSPARKIVLYTGHLYQWKGAHILAQAAEYLSAGVDVYLVGGTTGDQESFQKFMQAGKLSRCKVLGQVAYKLVPKYLAVADIVVIPNSGKFEISVKHTSPLKLFEYMAARKPIVSSDLPSLREVLDETCAVFFVPDDPISLARKIELLLADPDLAENITVNGAKKVVNYSWRARARLIKQFITPLD